MKQKDPFFEWLIETTEENRYIYILETLFYKLVLNYCNGNCYQKYIDLINKHRNSYCIVDLAYYSDSISRGYIKTFVEVCDFDLNKFVEYMIEKKGQI